MIAERLIGIVQPDVARAGGISEARKIILLAHAFHTAYGPHVGMSGAVCAAASLHLAASAPNFLAYECMVFESPFRDHLATAPVASRASLVDGCLALPDGPGLGIEISDEALERFRMD
jgi:L-alanine-DL-glutamate epimerase-like enolase superfamily enzyme